MKNRIVRTSAKKVVAKSNKMTKTPSVSKLDCLSDDLTNQRSLQVGKNRKLLVEMFRVRVFIEFVSVGLFIT